MEPLIQFALQQLVAHCRECHQVLASVCVCLCWHSKATHLFSTPLFACVKRFPHRAMTAKRYFNLGSICININICIHSHLMTTGHVLDTARDCDWLKSSRVLESEAHRPIWISLKKINRFVEIKAGTSSSSSSEGECRKGNWLVFELVIQSTRDFFTQKVVRGDVFWSSGRQKNSIFWLN